MLSLRGKNKTKLILSIIIITLVLVLILPVNAATLNTMSDKMSRGAPSTLTDHFIKFTTPLGIGAADQYIRISFESGFNLSAVDYTDIDFLHGPVSGEETAEVLSLVPNSTAWGAQVSDSRIDLTHPNNPANGDILPGEIVVIKIGLNAVGGDQQIRNPGTIGSKIISISSNNGESGKLAVAIYDDQIGVGGQTAGAPPNPVIFDNPVNISQSSMDFNWSKNIDWDFNRYELYFSVNPGVTNLTGTLGCTETSSSQTSCTYNSFSVGTDYYFVVYVYDTEGLFTPSNEVLAKTLGGGTTYPPRPAIPTIDQRLCPIFLSTTLLTGAKPLGTILFINNSADNIDYPTLTTWSSLVNVALGNNAFVIWGRDNYGQNSNLLNATVIRCEVGDTNCNTTIDDFDLAGLAYHWDTDWCYADFNEDKIVDDFDLSGLAAHWDSIY